MDSDGTLLSNVTDSSGITTSKSSHVYKVDFSGHFASYPSVTITCIATNDTSNRVAQISTLGQNFVEFTVENGQAADAAYVGDLADIGPLRSTFVAIDTAAVILI